jgi:hypothetical protein
MRAILGSFRLDLDSTGDNCRLILRKLYVNGFITRYNEIKIIKGNETKGA